MGIELTPRKITVTLLQGDDFQRQTELLAAVENAAHQVVRRRALRSDEAPEVDPVAAAALAYDEFMDGANERAAKVDVCQLRKGDWRDLIAEHLPREDNDQDARYGFNVATGSVPVVTECIDMGHFDSEAKRDEWIDALNDAHFTQLFDAAVNANQGMGPDPKARLSSRRGQTSGETSESPDRLG